MEKKNILIYPCGTDEGIELNRSLGQMIHYRLFGLDQIDIEHGQYIYENYLGSLDLNRPDALDRISQLVVEFKIDFIYPASVEAILMLSKVGVVDRAEVIAPSYETCVACSDRSIVMASLRGRVDFFDYNGCADPRYIAVCYTDETGILKFVRSVDRRRSIIKESYLDEHSKLLLHQTADTISKMLRLRGPWVFGFEISKEGEPLLVDISPGIAAIMSFFRNKGVNLATLSLFDRMGHNIEIRDHPLGIEAISMKVERYRIDLEYDDVYIDLDDTILVNNQVNSLMVAFLYQCRNKGKKIHLITKHRHELSETLEKYRIHALFDSIIWLKSFDQKSLHMKSERAIFIDDAFSERKQVFEQLGIPTFEVSAVESLMDWRL